MHTTPTRARRLAALVWAGMAATVAPAGAATPQEILAAYSAQAQAPASPERGQKMFVTDYRQPLKLTCSSCHGEVPVKPHEHELSGKIIKPLAPAANPDRFTDAKKVESWFRNNCKDVVGRECTAGEKADLLAWLISLKP